MGGNKLLGPAAGVAMSPAGIFGMTKSKKFREAAFPFLEDPESLFMLGGPSTAIPALGMDDYFGQLGDMF